MGSEELGTLVEQSGVYEMVDTVACYEEGQNISL